MIVAHTEGPLILGIAIAIFVVVVLILAAYRLESRRRSLS